jgi:hypothetical protein
MRQIQLGAGTVYTDEADYRFILQISDLGTIEVMRAIFPV